MAGILLLGSREGETVAVQFSPCLNEMNLIVHMRYILLPPFYRAFACNNCLGNSFTRRTRIEELKIYFIARVTAALLIELRMY